MSRLTHKQIAAVFLIFLLLCTTACTNTVNTHRDDRQTIRASVTGLEKYGHALLDITVSEFSAAGFTLGDVVRLRFGSHELEMPYFDGYYCNPGELMLRGKNPEALLAVCINYDSFSQTYGVAVGDSIEITMAEPAGMSAVQAFNRLQYTDRREDYASDAVFANFRTVSAGRIKDGTLFRSSSPVNNECGRASYADALMAGAGVATVLNASDSVEELEQFLCADGFDSAYYRACYDSGQVLAIDLAADFRSQIFADTVAAGLAFLSEQEPPYLIHCKEGKDRTGFICMILEALMGADLDEICSDYMISFQNYYGVTKEEDPQRYQVILDRNLLQIMCTVFGTADFDELEQLDLEAAATNYLLHAGMTQPQIAALKEKLS